MMNFFISVDNILTWSMHFASCLLGNSSIDNSEGSTSGGGLQGRASSSREDASKASLNITNPSQRLQTVMFKERQTMENLIKSMKALSLAREQQNEVGEELTKEVRRRVWLYSFLLKAQRRELHQCLIDECNKHGYAKDELMEAMKKVSDTK